MDFYKDCPYARPNKLLLSGFALWPYQSNLIKCCICILFLTWTCSATIAMIQGLTDSTSTDPVIICETIAAIALVGNNIRQWLFMQAKAATIKRMWEGIEAEWTEVAEPQEKAILLKFSKRALTIIMMFRIIGWTSYLWFLSLTYVPAILDRNISQDPSKMFPYYSRYWLIHDNCRNLQPLLHACMAALYTGIFGLAMTVLYLSSAMNTCALYAIVGHRLRNLANSRDGCTVLPPMEMVNSEDEQITRELSLIAKRHRQAIESSRTVQDLFSNNFFATQIVLLLILTILMFDFVYHIDKSTFASFKIVFLLILYVCYAFYINLGGQLISNHSNTVFISTHFIPWYSLPKRAQKILLLIIMRSGKADCLNNGIMTLSLENFTTIVKTAWSFAAVLLSLQRKKDKLH